MVDIDASSVVQNTNKQNVSAAQNNIRRANTEERSRKGLSNIRSLYKIFPIHPPPPPPPDDQRERARSPRPLTIPLNIYTLNSFPNFPSAVCRCCLAPWKMHKWTNVQNKDNPSKNRRLFPGTYSFGCVSSIIFSFHLQKDPTAGALCSLVIFMPLFSK